MCFYKGCKKHSIYNKEGEKAIYCGEHKQEGMVNTHSKRCIQEGCKKQPIYNKEGEKALYCGKHKQDGMINIVSKRCIHADCKKQPAFNKKGEKALYCAEHKQDGMIDVVNKRCIQKGCKKHPIFNNEGEKAIYCGEHKQDGMINTLSKRCIQEGCKKQPIYNKEGEKALYCGEHKQPCMIDVNNKRCKSEWCQTRVKEKYEGYCLYCYMNLFPDKPVSRNYKTKEYAVVDYVKTKFTQNWIADKRIDGGCSKRRPDLLLDLGDQVLIIEVDENQHIDYDCSCENKRLMELSQDVGHLPIVFIRFNPDDYQVEDKIITSCWGTDKKGICVVKNQKKEEWLERLNVLEKVIDYWTSNRTSKTVEVIQLFYG